MVCAFGLMSLLELPLQLFPDIERPQMSIQTGWRAASPQEMESEIVEPIEAVMQGLPGLEEIASNVNAGNSWINLTFAVGSDMDAMLVEVLSRMNRLQPLPRDADAAGGAGRRRQRQQLADLFLRAEAARHARRHPRLPADDRGPHRAAAVGGGRRRRRGDQRRRAGRADHHPRPGARRGAGHPDPAKSPTVAARATDVSGGVVEAGRREYVLRFAGRYSPRSDGRTDPGLARRPPGAPGRRRDGAK